MKSTFFKISLITVILLLGSVTFNSCSKSDEVKMINEPCLTQEEYKTLLIELNVKFWSNLSSNPISEIEKACNEKDGNRLVQLANLSEKELKDFMDKTVYYSSQINQNNDNSGCNCELEGSFDNILSFVKEIQKQGGHKVFFHRFSQYEYQNSNGSKEPPDWDKIANCMAVCTLTCVPLTWNPPAWAACIAGCTALCYYIPD